MPTFKKSFAPLCLVAALTTLLGACSSTPMTPAAPPSQPVAVPAPVMPAAPAPAPKAVQAPAAALPAYLDPKSDIYTTRSVYFDFDAAVIKPDFGSVIERHGRYLAEHPALNIKIEGNTDEQGGAEYNLALGQRRAEAVRKALKVYGVKDTQMEAISWGKERPKASGHDEASRSQNRRADLQYPKQ